MSKPRIVYRARPDATPEAEISALIAAYRFVLERHAARTAAAHGFRVGLEGGVDEALAEESNENVVSSPGARTQVSEFPREK